MDTCKRVLTIRVEPKLGLDILGLDFLELDFLELDFLELDFLELAISGACYCGMLPGGAAI